MMRINRGLSQAELAKIIDVSQQTVAKWETGGATPNPKTILKIANILEVTTDDLLGNNTNLQTNTIFPIILKKLRSKKGVSQQSLARVLAVSRSTVAMWETGLSQPNNDILLSLSRYFCVSVDYMLGNNEKYSHTHHHSNDDAKKLAEDITNSPCLYTLFDSAKTMSETDLQLIIEIINRLKKTK